jgi:hypothetical protein
MAEREEPVTLGREEAAVQARSAELRQELSIWDLAFAQILFIVGLYFFRSSIAQRSLSSRATVK